MTTEINTPVEATTPEASTQVAAIPAAAAAPAAPNGFAKLGLAPELLAAVADLGFTQPTTVQDACIGKAMGQADGNGQSGYIDLMVSSQTGSGKTAAFLLPVLNTLLKQQADAEAAEKKAYEDAIARGEAPAKKKRANPLNPRSFKAAVPGALILCPTRELAHYRDTFLRLQD